MVTAYPGAVDRQRLLGSFRALFTCWYRTSKCAIYRRQRVRKQWKKNMALGKLVANRDVAFFFVLGNRRFDWKPYGSDVIEAIEKENDRYKV